MIYPFKCGCGKYVEVFRDAADSAKAEICEDCGSMMNRVWTPFSFRIGLQNKVPAGMVEIGNENANVPNHKATYDVPNDLSEFPELANLSD